MSVVAGWVRGRADARTLGLKSQCGAVSPASHKPTMLTSQPFLTGPKSRAVPEILVGMADGHMETVKVIELWALVLK